MMKCGERMVHLRPKAGTGVWAVVGFHAGAGNLSRQSDQQMTQGSEFPMMLTAEPCGHSLLIRASILHSLSPAGSVASPLCASREHRNTRQQDRENVRPHGMFHLGRRTLT